MPSGAPTNAEYLLLASNGALTNYRIQTVSGLLIATDGGALGNYNIGLDQADLILANLPDLDTELQAEYLAQALMTTNGDLITRTAGAPSRLGIGSSGDVLTVLGGAPTWAAPPAGAQLLDSQPTQLQITGSTSLATLYTFSVPANTLALGDALRLTLLCDWLQNVGSNQNFTVKVSFGGTTLFQGTSTTQTSGSTPRATNLILTFARNSATNTLRLIGTITQASNTAPTTGFGNITNGQQVFTIGGDSAPTFSSANTLLVEWANGSSSGSVVLTRQGALLEHLPA